MAGFLKIQLLKEGAVIPVRKTSYSAGMDLFSSCDVTLPPHKTTAISTGLAIQLPSEHYGRIAERSSFCIENQLVLRGGVIDEDYRGEVKVLMLNLASDPYLIRQGEKIAQLICERTCYPRVFLTQKLAESCRGSNGFGSSNKEKK